MAYASDLFKWLQRKKYQYEVTFSLYMLTPTEKFVFSIQATLLMLTQLLHSLTNSLDSFLILFLSMIIIAASLYLPEHVTTVFRRAWFYYAGDDAAAARRGSATGAPVASTAPAAVEARRPKGPGSGLPGSDVLEMLEPADVDLVERTVTNIMPALLLRDMYLFTRSFVTYSRIAVDRLQHLA
ncbi:uncharacterized protein KY384_003700 [Bacidia gigantensis]|uniref:uncharacterized protein n=1 Tax=Bacidia gigantensis TaxID=2732470 RepID=UPI001D049DB8|nr:uncharacterized protein KY384_003700 [Bacidia gigantensis]KAG8532063.1 hypothetical protein KY384_003700 [Bacidia gigantensis]